MILLMIRAIELKKFLCCTESHVLAQLFERLLFIAYFHPILSIKSEIALDHVFENYSIFLKYFPSRVSITRFDHALGLEKRAGWEPKAERGL